MINIPVVNSKREQLRGSVNINETNRLRFMLQGKKRYDCTGKVYFALGQVKIDLKFGGPMGK